MKSEKIIYYNNETDDVVKIKSKPISICENYKYLNKNPFYKLASFVTYRLVATPYAYIKFKLFKKVKFHNTHLLKTYKNTGYFIYANHTNKLGDGFCPALICFPQKPHIIVNSQNVSIPIIGKFTKMWGALPIPENKTATINFYKAIESVLNKNNPIVIYPEAHLWPYYTKIRNFPTTSFRYPVKYNKPVFTFTTVYLKSKSHKKPKIEIWVDGPFYPNENTSEKTAQLELKNIVYNTLKSRANLSDYEYIKYVKRNNND